MNDVPRSVNTLKTLEARDEGTIILSFDIGRRDYNNLHKSAFLHSSKTRKIKVGKLINLSLM